MKKCFVLFICLLVSACTSQNDVFMGKPHMAVQQENVLKGRSMKTVRKFFGEPLSIRYEEPNQLWTYRQKDCTSLIYFDADNRVRYAESRGSCSSLKLPQIENNSKEEV